eukprot:CAMPEP_0197239932 /NCGR_PEP_ID=MMETSP1429-20130617/6330_1 /TAXON_ID=49237 /ORGANISM="Chaetoceros  sp., Strain UNC1202" /LENGTH=459 /DNA_ID=CAMNT_0042699477 /DNA_START=84 /DNA_END=1463 /DNA_ORIENTATION=+
MRINVVLLTTIMMISATAVVAFAPCKLWKSSSSSRFPSTWELLESKTNDAFLNSLEEKMDGSDPSPDSIATLRESATSSVAQFLSSFSEEGEEHDGQQGTAAAMDRGSNGNGASMGMGVDGNTTNGISSFGSSPSQGVPNDLHSPDSHISKAEASIVEWDVYICQSKPCRDRGASATLDTFQALSPSTTVQIHPAILTKTKAKGPNVRCIQRVAPFRAIEVNNVDDIDKVYRILTKHMNMDGISVTARDCLKFTYQGNAHLEKNELAEAISSYNSALATGYEPQEGILLLLRATAYLKRAFQHQAELRQTIQDLSETVTDPTNLGRVYQLASQHPSLSKPLFHKVLQDTRAQDRIFRHTKYRHGLYEYALLHAAQDSLRSTQLLPHHAKTWLRAGDALAELRKLKESTLYYQKAMELDPNLKDRLEPVIERLERSQEFLEKAKGWWSSDTLRLALDVAG